MTRATEKLVELEKDTDSRAEMVVFIRGEKQKALERISSALR